MHYLLMLLGFMLCHGVLYAKPVKIEKVSLEQNGGVWTAHVTFQHNDTDYNHFVDQCRIVNDKKKVLATLKLYHPHTKEKKFTEHLAGFVIPAGTHIIYVEAHAKPHGWSKKNRVMVDITKASGDRYEIRRKNPRQ